MKSDASNDAAVLVAAAAAAASGCPSALTLT